MSVNNVLYGPFCDSCPVKGTKTPYFDYSYVEPCDILFLADTFKKVFGQNFVFTPDELVIISDALNEVPNKDNLKISYSASVKCPGLRDKLINAKAKKACRNYLDILIENTKPTLIFACGNLAFTMLTKKSGISKYRGEIFTYTTNSGYECKVCPVFHPYSVVLDISSKNLFNIDVHNAIEKVIEGKNTKISIPYTVIKDVNLLRYKYKFLEDYEGILSCDLETTNFDFLKDRILTLSFSWRTAEGCLTIVIPYKHKDHNWSDEDFMEVRAFINSVLKNEKAIKVFHNAKFDLKFLINNDFEFSNIECSKNLAKFLNETRPNTLRSLVKEYFGVVLC